MIKDYENFVTQLLETQNKLLRENNIETQKIVKVIKNLIEFIDSYQKLNDEEKRRVYNIVLGAMMVNIPQK